MNEKDIALLIQNNGGKLYLVGGAVRDEIMGRPLHDKDYCVTGISKEKFINLFPNAKIIGKDFPVFLIDKYQVALARKDIKKSNGYKGFKVVTSKEISIEDDLKRRDLTINAIAKDVMSGEIIDPYSGIDDIKTKRLRHVSKSFSEDPLRAYRVARFASELEFEVDKKTYELMEKIKPELSYLTCDRVFLELRKALNTKRPSIFFNVLKRANILDVHFKEINDLIGVIQPSEYHPEGDVFNHTMIVLDRVAKETKDECVRFAALLHDLGKSMTPKEILPQHIGHDKVGIELVDRVCDRLNIPSKWRKCAKEVVKYHMKAGICTTMRPYKQAVFFNKMNRTSIGIKNLYIISKADDMLNRKRIDFSKIAMEVLKNINGKTLISNVFDPKILGKDRFLNLLYEKQAELIKKKEESYMKEDNNTFDLGLENVTQEEIENENSYKIIKEEDPIELLKAIVEEE